MTQALGLRILHHKPKVAEGARKIGLMCATWHAKKLKEQHITHITWMERHRKKRFETLTAHFWGGMPANCLWQLLRCCANKIKTDYHIIFNELSGTQLPSYPATQHGAEHSVTLGIEACISYYSYATLYNLLTTSTSRTLTANQDESRWDEAGWDGMSWDPRSFGSCGPDEDK